MKHLCIIFTWLFINLFLGSYFTLKAQNNHSDWWKYTTIYQIYPRSYQDSNGDGNGDLEGVISRLDHIKSLGIETIWLAPFYPTPNADWGYDISDYKNVAQDMGDLQTVDRLINEVHKRGMKIIFDMVINHTSDQHPWFIESSSSYDNPKRDWYVWRDGKNNGVPNNWTKPTGASAWDLKGPTDQYVHSSFLSFQPDLNLRNPEVKEALKDVMRFWLDKGVDGFRFDLVSSFFESPEFLDDPFEWAIFPTKEAPDAYFFQKRANTQNREEVITFSQELRQVLDEYPNKMGITEAMAKTDFMSRIQEDKGVAGIHQTMLLDFLFFFRFNKDYFVTEMADYITNFEEKGLTMTHTTGNHDRRRAMDMFGAGETDKAKMLALFQFTASGTALMFQGEEIGMTQGQIPDYLSKDPTAQDFFFNFFSATIGQLFMDVMGNSARLINRDNTRIPMQWDDSKNNAGFSTADETWLPAYGVVDGTFWVVPNKVNVADQQSDSNSMLAAYKEIISLRNTNEAIKKGSIRLIDTPTNNHILKDKYVFGYERKKDGEIVLVLLNFHSSMSETQIKANQVSKTLYETKKNKLKTRNGNLVLPGHSGVVLKMKSESSPFPQSKLADIVLEEPKLDKSEVFRLLTSGNPNDIEKLEILISETDVYSSDDYEEEIDEIIHTSSAVFVSPIPTENILTLKTEQEDAYISTATVYDLANKKVLTKNFSGNNNVEEVNVSSISPGKYVIVILHQDGKVSNNFFIKK